MRHGRWPSEREDLGWCSGLEENKAGPSGGGEGNRGIFNHSGHSGTSMLGLQGLGIWRWLNISHPYVTGSWSERTAYQSTWQRPKQDSCLNNNPSLLFYCTSHLLTVFITSNQVPLHVHAACVLLCYSSTVNKGCSL